MEFEGYLPIPGFPDYLVSEDGLIYSTKSNKFLSQKIAGENYLSVGLYKNGKRKHFFVHQLVAMAFLGHKPCGWTKVVDHINDDRTDNRAANLRIVTQRENTSKHPRGKSKFMGVSKSSCGRYWVSSIHINGKKKTIGVYKSELEASNSYKEYKLSQGVF